MQPKFYQKIDYFPQLLFFISISKLFFAQSQYCEIIYHWFFHTIINFQVMTKQIPRITFILIFAAMAICQQLSCPNQNSITFVQDSLTVSMDGAIALEGGVDIKCYNYVLKTPFNCTPGVAIGVNDLQSQYSRNLFFSVKAIASENNEIIPFVVRTHWGYTGWTRITFSFFAQISNQLEAGFYQVDTGSLSSCSRVSKAISAFLPVANQQISGAKAITFLSGFEISSISINSTYLTPFQIQIVSNNVTSSGISVLLQSTSATQVHSLIISYVIYSSSIPNLIAGTYIYKEYVPSANLMFSPQGNIANSNGAIHGFNGFILRNNQNSFLLRGQLLNGNMTFSTNSLLYYLSYSYLFLGGGPCGQCPGFNIVFNGSCIATCPPNFYPSQQTCVGCRPGQIWNGMNCVNRCNNGRVWNNINLNCQCPNGQNWNGNGCISCQNGQVWNKTSNQCACSQTSNWNGFICISCSSQIWDSRLLTCVCPSNTQWNGFNCMSCPNGQVWIMSLNACGCGDGSNWNGSACVRCNDGLVWNSMTNNCTCPPGQVIFRGSCSVIPSCSSGQVFDVSSNTCVCAQNTFWNGFICISCTNGQVWNSQSLNCDCPRGQNWNGYSCVACPTGQVWNSQTSRCSCPASSNWNGFSCITCTGGRTWSSSLNSCVCPRGLNWNGAICLACDNGSNWNGFSCIVCDNGQIWSSTYSICQCPTGQQWNGTACITLCRQGMANINGVCSCQAGFYDLNGVCTREPSCPSGQTWNGLRCTQISCPVGTFWNGTVCATSSNIVCPAGTYFDGSGCITNITNCPTGTRWSGSSCVASSNCPNGTYLNGSSCVAISQLCPNGMTWVNFQCSPNGNNCPQGTFLSNNQCIPTQSCTFGRVWNASVSQCVCPLSSFWNGNVCIQCSGGQIFQPNIGCTCPNGTFFENNRCASMPLNRCASILSSVWNGNACVCNPGYSVVGVQCACLGLAVNSTFCDRCFNKPNSMFINGVCRCNDGFSQIGGQCKQLTPSSSNIVPSCNVATYFDSQQKRCLPCSSGCLSCIDCYSCTQCQPGFTINFATSLCVQTCGDGRRFTLPCDDGNNNNGDGCSSDCRVQVGWTCSGGSPNSRDTCSQTIPRILTFTSTGQSHLFGKIILNVQANYLPLALIQSASDCVNRCNDVLSVQITSGDRSFTSIRASYISSTSFSFSIEIDYGRQPIGSFTAQIGINNRLVQRYFSGIDVSRQVSINVNPAFLAKYQSGNLLE